MIARTALALTVCGFAILPGVAGAQETLSYETGEYEYAQPLPELDDDVVTETTVDSEEPAPARAEAPTIQPIDPSNPEHGMPEAAAPSEPGPAARTIAARGPVAATTAAPVQPTYVIVQQQPQVVYAYPAPVAYAQPGGGAARVIYPATATQPLQPVQPIQYGAGYQPGQGAMPIYLPAGAQVVAFDRNAWLEECRARLDTYESDSDRGEIIGALVGAAAGGVLGNRIAGRGNRTAGTLIGAGAGALAGMAVGDAVEDSARRRNSSQAHCEAYLDDYMQQANATAGQVQYSEAGQYMLVPYTVIVPQKAVYSDGTPVD